MPELFIPEQQPKFPREDVSDTNAQIFEQLLIEPVYMFEAHEIAEEQVAAFKMGHAMIRSLGFALYGNEAHRQAFSYGATVYEALSATVSPVERAFPDNMHIRQKIGELMRFQDDTASGILHIMDEADRFMSETPTAAGLVEAAASMQPQFDGRVVMWRAALERSIDRDTLKTAA